MRARAVVLLACAAALSVPISVPFARSAQTRTAALAAITLEPSDVIGGGSITITVRLTAPAPAGGFAVAIRGGKTTKVMTVPEGQTTLSESQPTRRVPDVKTVTITATARDVSRVVTLTVRPGTLRPDRSSKAPVRPPSAQPVPPPAGRGAESASTPAPTGKANAYFAALSQRPGVLAAYSLRDQAQIEQYRRNKDRPSAVTYNPAKDPDPRRQDAAKIVIPDTRNSLGTQVWLPIPDYGSSALLVTWDAWFGKEFAYANTGVANHKAFQLQSGRIWTEIRNRYALAQREGGVSKVDIRQYGGLGQGSVRSPVVGGQKYGGDALGPMVSGFTIKAETWTRYWAQFEPRGDGYYYFSLWVADETRDAVTTHDRVLIAPSALGRWDVFRIELNTSTSTVKPRAPLVSYGRNVVMLHGVKAQELLQRPVR